LPGKGAMRSKSHSPLQSGHLSGWADMLLSLFRTWSRRVRDAR
jgi:hypothetical protein